MLIEPGPVWVSAVHRSGRTEVQQKRRTRNFTATAILTMKEINDDSQPVCIVYPSFPGSSVRSRLPLLPH